MHIFPLVLFIDFQKNSFTDTIPKGMLSVIQMEFIYLKNYMVLMQVACTLQIPGIYLPSPYSEKWMIGQ